MDSIIETLSITVSLVTLFLIPATLLTISYLIKRNGFYVSVNCWFCNSWTKVIFADRNSFYCPFCLQYNGFNKDGGYNKVIEEQFNTSLNKPHCKTVEKSGTFSSNGLCAYCNNNQQLKIRQLANFIPLNDKNYDAEVEHFRIQLEKSYKLCKKCDKILKKTIERQHAWIFGNRIKNLPKKGLQLLIKSKRFSEASKKSVSMNIVRYSLILFSLIVLCRAVNEKINYPKSTIKEYMPGVFTPYTVILNDWCHIVSNATDNFIKNMSNKLNLRSISDLKDARIIKNDILPITWFGLMLEIILLTWQTKSILWKANELLSWIILIITSLNTFHDDYFEYVNAVQIICPIAVIYSVLITSNPECRIQPIKKKFTFKKLKTNTEISESSDEEAYEDILNSSFCSKKSMSNKSCKSGNNFNASHSQNFLFQNLLRNTANVNDTFYTARRTKSSPVFNTSFKTGSINSSSNELHRSLDNLHLTNLSFNSQPCNSPVFSVNSVSRPILSPPKLKNITQNSWAAGGFWKNDVAVFPASTDIANLSRSSSQSSGFVSSNEPVVPNTYNSLPPSREPSLYGDFEKASILSEPTYHFTPINSGCTGSQLKDNFSFNNSHIPKPCPPMASQLYYKTDNNIFYPILKQNNMLLVQANHIPRFNFENSFSNLSLKSFNASNRFNTPVLFGEKPVISSLFKNLPGVSPQSHTFRAPHC
ncbi:uncharacterized protein LOC108912146 [Anoplophora glabripennis]|nr:uncharacterized protein LOC108912146 [Anoplophora glabripennis]